VCNVEQIGFLSTVARSCRQTPRLGSSPKAFGNGISAKRFRHMSPRLKEPSGQPFGAVILYFSGSDFVSFAVRPHAARRQMHDFANNVGDLSRLGVGEFREQCG
jgi:hypothetical protein